MGGNDWNNKFSVFGLRIIHLRLWSSKNMQGIWPKTLVPPVGHSWMHHSWSADFLLTSKTALTPAWWLASSSINQSVPGIPGNGQRDLPVGTWPTMPQRSAAWVSLRRGKAMRFFEVHCWLKMEAKHQQRHFNLQDPYFFEKRFQRKSIWSFLVLLVVLVVLLVFLVL